MTNGIISTNTTWNAAGAPYLLQTDVSVAANRVLTVEAGVSVLSDGEFLVQIQGGLHVDGTAVAPVTFSVNGSQARWRGIGFQGSDVPSFIFNASISKTTTGVRVDAPQAAVWLADVVSSDALQWAIAIENTTGRFSASSLTVARSGEGLWLFQSEDLTISRLRAEAMNGLVPANADGRYGVNATASNGVTLNGLDFRDAWIHFSNSSDLVIDGLRMQRVNTTSSESGLSLTALARPRISNLTIIDLYVGVTLTACTEANVFGLAGTRTRFTPLAAGMSVLLNTTGTTGRIGQVCPTNVSSYAMMLFGSGFTVDNTTVRDSWGAVWGRSSCMFENLLVTGTATGFVLSALDIVGGPAALKDVNIEGAAHPSLLGPGAGVREAHDIPMRQNVTVDGRPVFTVYKQVDPTPTAIPSNRA